MSHVDSMVLVVLDVASSLKCLVLYLHVVEERSVASFPGSSQTHRNEIMEVKKIATADVLLMPWGLVMWTNLRTSP